MLSAIYRSSQFAKGPLKDNVQVEQQDGGNFSAIDEQQLMGCAPYLQIFKAGKLLHTSAASLHVQQSEEELPFVQAMDGTFAFNINQIIQGDILIRCRHLTFGNKRVSMFRAAFHTGYVPPNVLRLTKNQLDGACHDKRYPDDFFLDLIFEKVDAEAIARFDKEKEKEESKSADDAHDDKGEKGKGPVVKASDVDSMLQGDSRFWDVISSKKQEHVKQANEHDDSFWGPTVGRRRGDSTKEGANDKNEKSDAPPTKERTHLETFSIGNEFDFLPVADAAKTEKESPIRDSLMDALNALDEEEGPSPGASEEIVFETVDSSGKAASQTTKPVFGDNTDAAIADGGNKQAEKEKPEDASATTTPPEDSALVEDYLNEEDDMDALLASADDDDFGDLDLADFDDDDDLEDLENMLKT